MTPGPDGNIWFVEKFADKIGRITPDGGEIKEFPLPRGSDPAVIVSGSDGYLWVLLSANGGGSGPQRIARVTPSGEIVEFPVPQGLNIVGIAKGNDGNLWFTEHAANRIGRMDTAGRILESFPVPTADRGVASITNGPDGNLWFDEQNGHNIARITLDGRITEFPYTAPVVPGTTNNHDPTAGPDGNVWFNDFYNGKIGRVTPEGAVTEYALPTAGSLPASIVAGTDQRLWVIYCVFAATGDVCQDYSTKIGSITVQGEITEYPLPNRVSGLGGNAVTPDGNVWFGEEEGNRIGRLTPK